MSIHPLRPHPHPVPEHSAALVKTGLSVSIQNARVTRAHSQISRRNSTLGQIVCDLDRDNRDKRISARAIGMFFFLKSLVTGFRCVHVIFFATKEPMTVYNDIYAAFKFITGTCYKNLLSSQLIYLNKIFK